jgi:ribose 1,5-bisphosphokinase PhnN
MGWLSWLAHGPSTGGQDTLTAAAAAAAAKQLVIV